MRRGDCDICCGSGTIRLPITRRSVARYDPSQSASIAVDQSAREYPCPECGQKIDETRIAVVSEHSDVADHRDSDGFQSYVREHAARALADQILRGGFINFEFGKTDSLTRTFQMSASVGVVSQETVATMEQRTAARQFEVAAEVVSEAKRQIQVWDSHYTGPDGNISKGLACSSVTAALNAVVKKRQLLTS